MYLDSMADEDSIEDQLDDLDDLIRHPEKEKEFKKMRDKRLQWNGNLPKRRHLQGTQGHWTQTAYAQEFTKCQMLIDIDSEELRPCPAHSQQ